MKLINYEARKSSNFNKEDTCNSSTIYKNERKVDKILDDIRKMKSSRDPISMLSSCRYFEPARKASQQFFK